MEWLNLKVVYRNGLLKLILMIMDILRESIGLQPIMMIQKFLNVWLIV